MRFFRKIWNVITSLAVAVMILLAVLLVGVRLFGLTPYTVLSGSMEPIYHVGSLIYVKKVEPQNITVGMPITFIVNEDLLVATHRVVDRREIDSDDGMTYYFQTKGDANEAVDSSPVHYKNVIGTPVFSIPLLGYLSSWLQTRQGTIMGIAIALVLLIFTFLPDLLKLVDDDKPEPPPAPEPPPPEEPVPNAAPVVRRRRSAKYEQKENQHED
ncbi:MAG: signal peptidase I [Clostridia bacterium]|nr:signal peptidase I [Clostridia bacterium]